MARKPTYLRAWRQHHGMTLEQVAHELGMTHAQLSKIERGQQPYNQDLLEGLALLYKVDPAHLLIQPPDHGGAEIIDMFAHASPEQRRQIAAVTEAIVGYRTDEKGR